MSLASSCFFNSVIHSRLTLLVLHVSLNYQLCHPFSIMIFLSRIMLPSKRPLHMSSTSECCAKEWQYYSSRDYYNSTMDFCLPKMTNFKFFTHKTYKNVRNRRKGKCWHDATIVPLKFYNIIWSNLKTRKYINQICSYMYGNYGFPSI